MRNLYLPLVVAIGGNVLYHLSQKSIPKQVSPLYALILTYALALALCVVAAFFYPHERSFAETVRESNWAVFGVGLAAFAIEFGVLLAYRYGGQVSHLGITVAVGSNLILIPFGLLVFRENLSARRIVGLIFCFLGLILVAKK